MSDHGVITEAGNLQFVRLLPGPIERVWAYLTDPEKRGRWLASGPMEPWVGGAVALRFHHADLSETVEAVPPRFKAHEQGSGLRGRIVRFEPPTVLSFTWGEDAGHSIVTFELAPEEAGVRLTLTHTRPATREELFSVSGGWHTHLGILSADLAGRPRPPFWSTHAALEAEYGRRFAAIP